MIVCLCYAVSDRTIRTTVTSGAESVDEVGERCLAGTGCGGCREQIEDIVLEARGAACPRAKNCAVPGCSPAARPVASAVYEGQSADHRPAQ